jgi:hypothetical protein
MGAKSYPAGGEAQIRQPVAGRELGEILGEILPKLWRYLQGFTTPSDILEDPP